MGGGLGEDPALPPPVSIPPVTGNGQGRAAGIADAPDPVAPAVMALLQQVLWAQQAIVGSLVCVANNQVHPQQQPQQLDHLQQQQQQLQERRQQQVQQQQHHHQESAQAPAAAPSRKRPGPRLGTRGGSVGSMGGRGDRRAAGTVSYTHLTLPTKA